MSAIRSLPRLAAVAAVLVGAGLTAMTLATPAFAADGEVKVTLSNLADSVNAGSTEDFSVKTQNTTNNPLQMRRVILVQLGGLDSSKVNITRRGGLGLIKTDLGNGAVRFEEGLGYNLAANGQHGDTLSVTYTLRFDQSAPQGQAAITAGAESKGASLGSASGIITVKPPRNGGDGGSGGQNQGPPPTTHAETVLPPVTVPPPSENAIASNPLATQAVVPTSGNANDGGIPMILYVLGAVLVLLGGGILFMLFRSPKPALVEGYETTDYPQVRPTGLGYPGAPRPSGPGGAPARHSAPPTSPTALMPAVGDPRVPAPGVDPWANSGVADPTREFPRHS